MRMIGFDCGWKAGCDLAVTLGLLEKETYYFRRSTYLERYRFGPLEFLASCGWVITFNAVFFCLWKLFKCVKFEMKTRTR